MAELSVVAQEYNVNAATGRRQCVSREQRQQTQQDIGVEYALARFFWRTLC